MLAMHKEFRIYTSRFIACLVFAVAAMMLFTVETLAGTLQITGKITSSAVPVRNASVLFIDNGDPVNTFSALTDGSGNYQIDVAITSIEPHSRKPVTFRLEQNYPNPFSSSTAISYKLNTRADVVVTIYDILGRQVRKFSLGVQPDGAHKVRWDGTNALGQKVASGIYFYRLQAGNETRARKMIFSSGGSYDIMLPPDISFSRATEEASDFGTSLQESEFTVRITNTNETYPPIVPLQEDNVSLMSDTTLDFSVLRAVAVYLDSARQIIRGFGAANILFWRPDMTVDQITRAFGTGDGQVGLSILRLRIPTDGNEFSANVPTASAAYSMGVKIIASPWSPPASMKTNNSTVGGRLRQDAYNDFAAHLKSFADYMANNNVPLYAVSVQNEPDVSVTYECCDWNASEMLTFMKENAPGVGVPVFAPESYHFDHALSDPILNDSVAAAHTAFIGGHIYGGGLNSYPLAVRKGKEIWMTEHLDTDMSWSHVLATGKEINDCMAAGMSAYIWWYIVRFYGPILEDGNVSKRGYVMSQFARFVRPGFFRVDATGGSARNIYVTAYRNNSKVVIVAVNTYSSSVSTTFVIRGGPVTNLVSYVTSETKNCLRGDDRAVSNGSFDVMLDGSSITTFVSE